MSGSWDVILWYSIGDGFTGVTIISLDLFILKGIIVCNKQLWLHACVHFSNP